MSSARCTIFVTNNAAVGNPSVDTVSAGWTIEAASAALAGVPVGHTPSLSIDDIGAQDLPALMQLIQEHLPKVAHLSMRFSPADHARADTGAYLRSLAALWKAFTQAPQLRSLALLAGQEIMYQIPFTFLNRTPPPHLSFIDIQGFQLEELCPAFVAVSHVRVDVAVIAGVDVKSLGELFPGADRIDIVGLESVPLDEDGDSAAGQLTFLHRVPKVTAARPIPKLYLEWAPTGSPSPRPADANWVLESAPFVGTLDLDCPDHEDVRLRALDALAPRATTLSLKTDAFVGIDSELVVSGQGQHVRFVVPDAAVVSHLSYICAPPFPIPVATLSVAASRLHALVGLVRPPEGFPFLRHLELELDVPINYGRKFYLAALLGALPQFDSVQTLAVLGPGAAVLKVMGDPTAGLAELKGVLAPNAQIL